MRFPVAIPVALVLIASPALAQPEPKDAKAFVERGKEQHLKGEYEKAIGDFTEAIKLDPKLTAAYLGRGMARQEGGDPLGALSDFTEAIRLDPKNPGGYHHRGQARAAAGWHDRAVEDFTKALELDPKLPRTLAARGKARIALDKLDDALIDLTDAIRLDPKFGGAYLDRGIVRAHRGELDLALSDFAEALQREPKSASAFYHRGATYLLKGDFEKASDDLDAAIRIDAKNPAYLLARSSCRLLQARASTDGGADYMEKLEAALKDADEAVRLDPKNADALLQRGLIHMAGLKLAEARADYDAAIKLRPDTSKALIARAGLLAGSPDAKHRDGVQAYKDAHRACELTEWKDPDALAALAAGASAIGDFEAAVKWQKKALENPEYAKSPHAPQGKLCLALYEAKKPFRIDLETLDGGVNGLIALAGHWLDNGEFEKAVKCCDEALRLDAKNANAYMLRGWSHCELKDYPRGIKDFGEAIKLDPKYVLAFHARAYARAARGEWEQALADCDDALRIDPKYVNVLSLRAEIRAGCPDAKFRDSAKALKDAREACELTNWKSGFPLQSYAAACAEAGDFAEALKWQLQAAKDEPYMERRGAIVRGRLESYQAKKPLRLVVTASKKE